jgi:pimeloyl-ACP methyl ester carboxylesterase
MPIEEFRTGGWMTGFARWLLLLATLSGLLSTAALAATSSLVTIPTPRGASQSFILIKPEKPVASVVLFAGGSGVLGLKSSASMASLNDNFLVRTRDAFAGHGFVVAVVDAPSDHQRDGMNAIFRMSSDHAGDIGAVTAYLKSSTAGVPIWLIGTSMGTFSAAEGAIAVKGVDGLVLTSTITRSPADWIIVKSHPNGVASMSLGRVTVPTLILSHRKDGCPLSPATGASKLQAQLARAGKVQVSLLEGGSPPQSGPCDAKAPHGYFGIETVAVDTVAKFIAENSK